MDLKQRKLNKSEWNSIEVPVSTHEKHILNLIISGFHDVNIRINHHNSIFTFLKIEYTTKMEDFVYNKYIRARGENIETALASINPTYKKMKIDGIVKLNSCDKIRLDRFDHDTLKNEDVYEFVLLNHIERLFENYYKKNTSNKKMFHYHYFTLHNLCGNNIVKLNRHLKELSSRVLDIFKDKIEILTIIQNAYELIEKNDCLLKYEDLMLYEHQKKIFKQWQIYASNILRKSISLNHKKKNLKC